MIADDNLPSVPGGAAGAQCKSCAGFCCTLLPPPNPVAWCHHYSLYLLIYVMNLTNFDSGLWIQIVKWMSVKNLISNFVLGLAYKVQVCKDFYFLKARKQLTIVIVYGPGNTFRY